MAEATKSPLALPMNQRQRIRRAIILVSFLLFPVTLNYFSPYIIINGAAQGIIAGSFITFALLFIFSLGFGRAWCGWACPVAGIQEWCFSINNKAAPGGKLNWIKYFIWVPWLSAIIAMAVLVGGLSRVNPLHMTDTRHLGI